MEKGSSRTLLWSSFAAFLMSHLFFQQFDFFVPCAARAAQVQEMSRTREYSKLPCPICQECYKWEEQVLLCIRGEGERKGGREEGRCVKGGKGECISPRVRVLCVYFCRCC
jgi:hypothetical protein